MTCQGYLHLLHLACEIYRRLAFLSLSLSPILIITTALVILPGKENFRVTSQETPDMWVNAGLQGMSVSVILIDPTDPTIVYATASANCGAGCTPVADIFRSTDAGKNWISIGTRYGLPIPPYDRGGAELYLLDPDSPQTLHVLISNSQSKLYEIYKSVDRGNSWFLSPIKMPKLGKPSWTTDPRNPQKMVMAFNSPGPQIPGNHLLRVYPDIYRSTNGGTSWTLTTGQKLNNLLPGNKIEVFEISH